MNVLVVGLGVIGTTYGYLFQKAGHHVEHLVRQSSTRASVSSLEVEILDGATVKRVLSTTTTSAVYTAAQQSADWGAPLGPGDTLDIRIYQLSALVGRGAQKTVTLRL